MPRIKLTLEYEGTRYHGWQKQPAHPSIQQELEEKASQIAKHPVQVIGAGRTDAGVHAEGQVAHFDTLSKMEPEMWQRALNSLLPPDIGVIKAEKVPVRFHARYSAKRKHYRYAVLNRAFPSPLNRHRVWCVFSSLHLPAMQRAARLLKGRHDFDTFRSSSCTAKNTELNLQRLDIRKKEDIILFDFEAPSFLMHMVRNFVGALVAVGRGKITPKHLSEMLEGRTRPPFQTAPPQGLCLMKVRYTR